MAEQPAGSPAPQDAEVSLLDLALVVTSNLRVLIVLSAIAGTVAFAAASIRIASTGLYTATAKALLPPGAPLETYVVLLKSEALADRLVRQFKLAQAYGASLEHQARAILIARTRITSGRPIMVSVDDADAQRAAELANGYVAEVRELARMFAITDAAQRRLYYERRVQCVTDELSRARTLRHPEPKGRAAALCGAENELTASELAVLREKLDALDDRGKRASRDFRYHEAVLQLLTRRYELARFDEARLEIQLLDAATVPDTATTTAPRSAGRRALIAFAAMVATLTACVVALFVREWLRRESATGEGARKLALIRESLRWRR